MSGAVLLVIVLEGSGSGLDAIDCNRLGDTVPAARLRLKPYHSLFVPLCGEQKVNGVALPTAPTDAY